MTTKHKELEKATSLDFGRKMETDYRKKAAASRTEDLMLQTCTNSSLFLVFVLTRRTSNQERLTKTNWG